MKYIQEMAVIELEVPFDDKVKLMFLVHFGFEGNLTEFKHKLNCKNCLDYEREGCAIDKLPVDRIVDCMTSQAREQFYTAYCPEKAVYNNERNIHLIEYLEQCIIETKKTCGGYKKDEEKKKTKT